MIQTSSQLVPSYARPLAAPSVAQRHTVEQGSSPWLFTLAPLSFALTLAVIMYLSAISF